jgi:tRNA 2-thiouridine synthesizing protein A
MTQSKLWLDARRLLCPLPVIRVQERVQQLAPGDCLDVVFSDKGSLADIVAWCRLHGHQILARRSIPPDLFITVQIGQN